MCALRKPRVLLGTILLGLGSGLAMANGSAPAQPQTIPAMNPPVMAQAPMWLQMVPIPGTAHYYLMPQPGMTWPVPVAPQYPAPMPFAAPAAWAPFVWVLVPVPPIAAMPATVDYGPVADAPVVELPPDEVPAATTPEGAALAPVTMEADQAASVPSPAPVTAPVEATTTNAAALNPAMLAAAAPESVSPPVVSAPPSAITVNYGPVTPTPVVNLLALEKRAAAARSRNTFRAKPQGVRKATATALKPLPAAAAKPVKRRLCWSNGVVAPCR